jgi:hypothetical protein
MIELREDACAVGAVGGDLALLVVGQPGQGRRQVEGGRWERRLE